ncbi:hypothetical protein SH2C18_03890 [Clostridium sediminicola]|uniref:hypothetical protein n=1 Tax=Clostridium sediminicola TaxID=3114879 RepID=UPI0031F1CC79
MPTLKEIGFDVRYIPSEEVAALLVGKSEEERNKITVEDYNKNYKQRNVEFRYQTRCIASFYERCFKSYKNDKCWKILIECVPNVNREPMAVLGIYHVQVSFDINDFFKLDDLEKKRKTLELINTAVSEVVKKENWDEAIFENAYNRVIKENYVNKWVWKKPKNNPGRKYLAKVLLEHDIYSCDISIIITDKKEQVIKRKLVVKEKPSEWMFAKYFGNLKWLSNKEVALIDRSGSIVCRVNVD